MSGKFLNMWPLRSVARALAALIIIALGVAIYATREVPPDYEEDEEWKMLRNIDFSFCVVSLAFASVLLYGSITEFRLFILAWMMWNVALIVFWVTFLIWKCTEFVEWERKFRLVAVIFMALSEIPVISYYRHLRITHSDPESNFTWVEEQPDKMYNVLSDKPSSSSLNTMFVRENTGKQNEGFETDVDARSVISIASEETEENETGKVDKDGTVKTSNASEETEENETGKVDKDGTVKTAGRQEADEEPQSGFQNSATVYKTTAGEQAICIELEKTGRSRNEPVFAPDLGLSTTQSEVSSPNTLYQGTLPDHEEYKTMQVAEAGETHVEIKSSTDITDDEYANEKSFAPENHTTSVTLEIDVTDMAPDDVNQTSHF